MGRKLVWRLADYCNDHPVVWAYEADGANTYDQLHELELWPDGQWRWFGTDKLVHDRKGPTDEP